MFVFTAFDHESIGLMGRLGMTILKIPSGEIFNLRYLRHVGPVAHKVALSMGSHNL